jgi:LuxR family transcriptional regulator, maltose regulon positive regulatory protein
MEVSLLATKIGAPPTRARLVPRPRLLDRLHDGLDHSLVLVSAPAGFGKTTLVSDWSRRDPSAAQTSWLSLDEGDNDPVRFWDYVVAALRTSQPGVGETTLALLRSPPPVPAQTALIPLLNELSAVSQDFVLVLDDYQFIKSREIHAGLTFLLDHLPTRMHLLIATRADPPFSLARLRGRGRLLEVGADDLRFTVEETSQLMRDLRVAQLPFEDVSSLNQRTEGWAVGLKMAALSMGQREDVSEFIADFAGSQRYVMDYLLEEVLEQQPEDVQDFLLRTSVLDTMSAPLCDAITGRTDSEALLPALERANLFLVPLDQSRHWFRYEHLFAELLRHQLTRISGETAITKLHTRASDWYKRNGLLGEAIDHALAARGWETALDLLAEASEPRLLAGEMTTLLAWFRAVPEDVLLTRHRLCGDYSMALTFTGQVDAADSVLARVEAALARSSEAWARVTALRAIVESVRGNIPGSAALAQASLPLLSPADVLIRASVSLNLGVVYWYLGLLDRAEPLYQEAYEAAQQAGNPSIAMVALSGLADMARWRGQLSKSIELCGQAIDLAPESPFSAHPRGTIADPFYERNMLEQARAQLNSALGFNRLLGHRPAQWEALSALAQVSTALGDEAAAEQATAQVARLLAGDTRPEARSQLVAHHLLLALNRGDLEEASQWGDRLMSFDGPVGFWNRLLLIRLLGAQGRHELVAEHVRRFYASAEVEPFSPEWRGWLIVIRIGQALCAPEPEEGVHFLAEALAAAEPEGWIRSFVDEGPRLAPLLRQARSRGISPEYAAKLLTIIQLEERRRAQSGTSSQPSALCALLTDRELEILGLVAAGLANRQIAGRLFVSLGTVKVHLHNIAEKLHTANRTEAVARARELGVL